MTHELKVAQWLGPFRRGGGSGAGLRDFGVEIGPYKTPIPGIRPYYVDRFQEYANEKCLGDYWGDAADLPFRRSALDYVASSHVLEHAANPVAAIFEWCRVVGDGGILYLVVPDRRHTFDHRRALTSPEHMMEDFARRVDNTDGTHIDEYLDNLDWSLMQPGGSAAQHEETRRHLRAAYREAVGKGGEVNIHFHVFEPSNLAALVGLMNALPGRPAALEIVDRAERFPENRADGFLLVLRVRKGPLDRLRRAILRAGARVRPEIVLSRGARPLFGGVLNRVQ